MVLVVRGNRGAFIVRYRILSRLFCLAYGPFSRELIRALGVGTCVSPAIASNISLLVHIRYPGGASSLRMDCETTSLKQHSLPGIKPPLPVAI